MLDEMFTLYLLQIWGLGVCNYICQFATKQIGVERDIPVVPTTTPPLVWPSNGENKGAPTKILNPTPMEGWI
jgi:hypothetical protein